MFAGVTIKFLLLYYLRSFKETMTWLLQKCFSWYFQGSVGVCVSLPVSKIVLMQHIFSILHSCLVWTSNQHFYFKIKPTRMDHISGVFYQEHTRWAWQLSELQLADPSLLPGKPGDSGNPPAQWADGEPQASSLIRALSLPLQTKRGNKQSSHLFGHIPMLPKTLHLTLCPKPGSLCPSITASLILEKFVGMTSLQQETKVWPDGRHCHSWRKDASWDLSTVKLQNLQLMLYWM